jgi:uncharacterized caspase-like protein
MTKRVCLFRFLLIFSAMLFGATASSRVAWSQTTDGRYAGSFSCSVAGPNPAFSSILTTEISGGRFTIARQTRFGLESFTGVVDASGAVSVDGGGRSDSGGPGEWWYDLKGAMRDGRLEATGRMYTRRDPNLRICTLSLNRAVAPGQSAQASRKPEQPDPLAAALLENEQRQREEEEPKAKQLADEKARQELEQKRQAEAEVRARAEAKAKADAEAKAKAEADAKAQQLAQAKAARERQELEDRVRLAEQRAKEAEEKAKQEAEARRTAQTAAPIVTAPIVTAPIVTAAVAPPPSVAAPAQAGRATMIPQASDLVFAKPGAEQRIALVIGNSAYQHAPRLDNPQSDARAMAAALLKTGFELIGGGAQLDLDKSRLERAIYDFSRRLRQGTVGMFYYAGHGFEVSGRNYLAPIDANPTSTRDIDFMLVDVDLLMRQLRDADSRLNMVVLDACRNNPFGGAGLRGGGGLAEIKSRPSGTIISFATAAGEVARDGPPGQNSPYTAALVSAILKPGLSVLDTFNDVAISVQRATNREQQPWIQSTGIQGQFFFVPPAGGAPSATPAAAAQSGGGMDRDALFWSSVKDSRDPAQLQAYLTQFPDGVYAPLARIWIEDAKRAAKPKP